ncbi:hypothetical protein [Nostoc sp.]|uniref:hypothetical protein n=1 Tax=Nostoc sp. TaxID=1180 RepID=UPI002FF7114E
MAIIEANAYLKDHCRLGIKSTSIGRHNFCLTRLLCKHLDSFTLPQFYPKYFPNISQPELQGLDTNKYGSF